MELLYSPEDCILETSPQFKLIVDNRDKFLTKKCRDSFGGYAVAQIKKAKGLNKKMNWEASEMTRKTVLDFCYVLHEGGSIPFKEWMEYAKVFKEAGLIVKSSKPYFTTALALMWIVEATK